MATPKASLKFNALSENQGARRLWYVIHLSQYRDITVTCRGGYHLPNVVRQFLTRIVDQLRISTPERPAMLSARPVEAS